jgi:hypothetical protein
LGHPNLLLPFMTVLFNHHNILLLPAQPPGHASSAPPPPLSYCYNLSVYHHNSNTPLHAFSESTLPPPVSHASSLLNHINHTPVGGGKYADVVFLTCSIHMTVYYYVDNANAISAPSESYFA